MKLLATLALLTSTTLSVYTNSSIVNVAIMHSLTGTMEISEKTVVNAEILAIEEINATGGVLGKKIVYNVYDGASSPSIFAQKAQMITSDPNIATTFGCWTSSSRKAVKPIFEAANKQLWYPVQYEGQECSKNIFYSGATPNQQIEPAVFWLLDNYPNRNMYLVGSDYVFPRTANSIIQSLMDKVAGNVVGEKYVPLPSTPAESAQNNIDLNAILDDILVKMPNGGSIFNSLNGDANIQLFTLMQQKGMSAAKYPTMSGNYNY
jgi:urea transport system substrate-binding protein